MIPFFYKKYRAWRAHIIRIRFRLILGLVWLFLSELNLELLGLVDEEFWL
jgi:hypothetical protein